MTLTRTDVEPLPDMHVSRSWPDSGTPLEDECPCPQEACGHVAWSKVVEGCPQHNGHRTIRSGHRPEDCPGKRSDNTASAAIRAASCTCGHDDSDGRGDVLACPIHGIGPTDVTSTGSQRDA